MALIQPFKALRPRREKAPEVASVPYDVVDTEEARKLAEGLPWSFLHITRAEIDLAPGVDIHGDAVYSRAAQNFSAWREQGPSVQEEEPSFYLYRLRMGNHSQTGLVACCSVDEYQQDIIRKHERTRQDKEKDRTRHILAVQAQTGPVFLTHRPVPEVDHLSRPIQEEEPLYDFTAPDGIAHTVWRVPVSLNPRFQKAFADIPFLYIADGHHRAAAACLARQELARKNTSHSGREEYNFFQGVIFPADQLQILPYNRVVRSLGSRSPAQFRQALEEGFALRNADSPHPSRGEFCMYLEGRWHLMKPRRRPPSSDPIHSLDVSILQDQVLGPLLGIEDPRTSPEVDFVGGIRGTGELEQRVDSGKSQVAFSLHPTTLDDLMAIADAGEIMPPKSTWFEPKLRDGLLCHLI